jgi:ankyrin repeat protein
MQSLVKNFFETIKKGDVEQVIHERNKLNIDVSTL